MLDIPPFYFSKRPLLADTDLRDVHLLELPLQVQRSTLARGVVYFSFWVLFDFNRHDDLRILDYLLAWIVKVILHHFLRRHNERFDNSVLEHLESRYATSHLIDVREVQA